MLMADKLPTANSRTKWFLDANEQIRHQSSKVR